MIQPSTKKELQHLVQMMKEGLHQNYYFGIRFHPHKMIRKGDWVPESRIWRDGHPTDDALYGTYCFDIRKLVKNGYTLEDIIAVTKKHQYRRGEMIIIFSREAFPGDRENVILMRDPIRYA